MADDWRAVGRSAAALARLEYLHASTYYSTQQLLPHSQQPTTT